MVNLANLILRFASLNWGIPFWSLLFVLTPEKPLLRSYIASCLLSFFGYLFFMAQPTIPFFRSFGTQISLGYYLFDFLELIEKRASRLFLFHHTIALTLVYETLSYDEEQFRLMSLLTALMDTSTIFLNWKEMNKNQAYKGWYPSLSTSTLRFLFGGSFLLFRCFICIPLTLASLPLFPPFTGISLFGFSVINMYWGIQILLALNRGQE